MAVDLWSFCRLSSMEVVSPCQVSAPGHQIFWSRPILPSDCKTFDFHQITVFLFLKAKFCSVVFYKFSLYGVFWTRPPLFNMIRFICNMNSVVGFHQVKHIVLLPPCLRMKFGIIKASFFKSWKDRILLVRYPGSIASTHKLLDWIKLTKPPIHSIAFTPISKFIQFFVFYCRH